MRSAKLSLSIRVHLKDSDPCPLSFIALVFPCIPVCEPVCVKPAAGPGRAPQPMRRPSVNEGGAGEERKAGTRRELSSHCLKHIEVGDAKKIDQSSKSLDTQGKSESSAPLHRGEGYGEALGEWRKLLPAWVVLEKGSNFV